MASLAVSAVAGVAPVASQPRASAKASGFLSGGVRVPRRSAFARASGDIRARAVTRAAAPEVRSNPRVARRAPLPAEAGMPAPPLPFRVGGLTTGYPVG